MSSRTRAVAVAQCKHRQLTKRFYRARDIQEGWPEIVSPLRNAMRFVNHQEPDTLSSVRVEQVNERRLGETFRRDEHDTGCVGRDALQRIALRSGGQRAVDQRAIDAGRQQLVGLILHQRDERRDHQRDAVEMQGGQLIAQGFTGAGRHCRQCVLPLSTLRMMSS